MLDDPSIVAGLKMSPQINAILRSDQRHPLGSTPSDVPLPNIGGTHCFPPKSHSNKKTRFITELSTLLLKYLEITKENNEISPSGSSSFWFLRHPFKHHTAFLHAQISMMTTFYLNNWSSLPTTSEPEFAKMISFREFWFQSCLESQTELFAICSL